MQTSAVKQSKVAHLTNLQLATHNCSELQTPNDGLLYSTRQACKHLRITIAPNNLTVAIADTKAAFTLSVKCDTLKEYTLVKPEIESSTNRILTSRILSNSVSCSVHDNSLFRACYV